jgi:hypothetical protein
MIYWKALLPPTFRFIGTCQANGTIVNASMALSSSESADEESQRDRVVAQSHGSIGRLDCNYYCDIHIYVCKCVYLYVYIYIYIIRA